MGREGGGEKGRLQSGRGRAERESKKKGLFWRNPTLDGSAQRARAKEQVDSLEQRARAARRQAANAPARPSRRRAGRVCGGRRAGAGGGDAALRLHGQAVDAESRATRGVVANCRRRVRDPHRAGRLCAVVQLSDTGVRQMTSPSCITRRPTRSWMPESR